MFGKHARAVLIEITRYTFWESANLVKVGRMKNGKKISIHYFIKTKTTTTNTNSI